MSDNKSPNTYVPVVDKSRDCVATVGVVHEDIGCRSNAHAVRHQTRSAQISKRQSTAPAFLLPSHTTSLNNHNRNCVNILRVARYPKIALSGAAIQNRCVGAVRPRPVHCRRELSRRVGTNDKPDIATSWIDARKQCRSCGQQAGVPSRYVPGLLRRQQVRVDTIIAD